MLAIAPLGGISQAVFQSVPILSVAPITAILTVMPMATTPTTFDRVGTPPRERTRFFVERKLSRQSVAIKA